MRLHRDADLGYLNRMKFPRIVLACLFALLPASALAAVESISAEEVDAAVASQKGILVLSLSSVDPRCQPCLGANEKFRMLALGSNTARYVQVVWQPWMQLPAPVRTLLARHGLPASIPVRLAFRNGKLVDKLVGEPPMPPQPRTYPQIGRVEVVEPLNASRRLQASRGLVVVMLSSFEPDCAFCMRANLVFEDLAALPAAKESARFLRVMYRPWTSAGSDPLGEQIGISGLPVFIVYKDGTPVHRHDGIATVDELRKELLAGDGQRE
jgi:hypothetical protein